MMGALQLQPANILGQKVARELCEYKRWMKKQTKEYIFDHAYEIDCMISFYENIMEMIRSMPEEQVMSALNMKNVLRSCYEDWLKKDDDTTQQQIDSICETLQNHAV